MKSLTINDLVRTEELDHSAMAAVRGGYNMGSQFCNPCYTMPSYCLPYSPGSSDSSINTKQDLTQLQQVTNATADGSAYLCGLDVTNKTKQFGQNNISVG